MKVTGSVGDVMNESAAIAQTFAKTFLAQNFPNHNAASFLSSQDIHVHVPEGSTPKAHFPIYRIGRSIRRQHSHNCSHKSSAADTGDSRRGDDRRDNVDGQDTGSGRDKGEGDGSAKSGIEEAHTTQRQ